MKFSKKISIYTLITIMVSTSSLGIASADTIDKNVSNNSINLNSQKLISQQEAKNIMLNKVPGANIVSFELDYDDEIPQYEGKLVKGNKEYEIVVNALNGTILEFESDIIDDYNPSNGTLIGDEKAKNIMLNKVPGGKFISFELDYDDSTPEYEAKMVKGNKEYEITVNGYTGQIIDFEIEDRYDYSGSSNPNIDMSNFIGEEKAKSIMLSKVPGAQILKFTLDFDDRVPEYKGKLVKGYREYEVSVHAINGKIIDFSSEMFDDSLDHWAEDTIFEFYNKGYINGYNDNSFKPNNTVTRAEFVKTLNKVFNLTKSSGVVFKDTADSWAKLDIDIAVTNGVCKGASKDEFRPNSPITREEAAVMIANYLKLGDKNHDKLSQFDDEYNVSPWAKDAVESLLEKGYLTGTSINTISPKKTTTRAESITLLSRVDD